MSRIWRELSTLKLTIINHQSTIRLALSREPIRLLPDFKKVVRKNWLSRPLLREAVWVPQRVWRRPRNNSSRKSASLMPALLRKMEGLLFRVSHMFQSRPEQRLEPRAHKFLLKLLTSNQWNKDHLFTTQRISQVPKDIIHSQSRRPKPHLQSATENQLQKSLSTMNQNTKTMMEPI